MANLCFLGSTLSTGLASGLASPSLHLRPCDPPPRKPHSPPDLRCFPDSHPSPHMHSGPRMQGDGSHVARFELDVENECSVLHQDLRSAPGDGFSTDDPSVSSTTRFPFWAIFTVEASGFRTRAASNWIAADLAILTLAQNPRPNSLPQLLHPFALQSAAVTLVRPRPMLGHRFGDRSVASIALTKWRPLQLLQRPRHRLLVGLQDLLELFDNGTMAIACG